jgi:glycosyltransferase involved in cell wall biosynthesis
MKVTHVTDSFLPTIGGLELHVRDLATRQRAAGFDVGIVTRTPAGAEDAKDWVRRIGSCQSSWLESEAPDVVHAHVSIVSPFALAAARRAALRGVSTVITVHSIWTNVGPLPQIAREVWGMRDWPVTWTAVSERAAKPVRDLLRVSVQVVPNAVDLREWSAFEELPAVYPPRVLSVTRLTSVKRALPLARILSQAARQAQFTATIVGDGPERAALQRYLKRQRLADRVLLAGALTRPEIRRLLEQASIFVAPAHRESFGIAALEARASGVPVVASARSGIGTFVEHDREGLLGLSDQQMGGHLVRLLNDPGLRERVARYNRLVPPPYGWDEALVRNHEMYVSAAARRSSRVRPALDAVLAG